MNKQKKGIWMNDNTKFTILLDMLNRKIADLNIELSKNPANKDDLNRELEVLLKDREMLYAGDYNDFCEILSKYGDTIND